jgi:hypothetical protein
VRTETQNASITLISTVHKAEGRCNGEDLFTVLQELGPDVIFLEANSESYTKYEKLLHHEFGQYHRRLELEAIQRYQEVAQAQYVPVLGTELSEALGMKLDLAGQSPEHRRLFAEYQGKTRLHGVRFLNTPDSENRQQQLRELEDRILGDHPLSKQVEEEIDAYEQSMLDNIDSYCSRNAFAVAVFLCGVAHRRSIVQKVETQKAGSGSGLVWRVYKGQLISDPGKW